MTVDDRNTGPGPAVPAGPDAELTSDSDELVRGRAVAEVTTRSRASTSGRLRAVNRSIVVAHRWIALALGLVLLAVTTSGAALLYSPEWTKWTNSSAFAVSHSDHPIPVGQAMDIVAKAHPFFQPGSLNVYDGLYEVFAADEDAHPGFYGVDPGSGRITGYVSPNRGVMAFLGQVHECFFSCDEYPAYLSPLNHPVPSLGTHWLKAVTWGGLLLGVSGLLLVFLGVSGIWLWWPGIKKWRRGFQVRTGKGRYVRDYDLHQVVGMAAIPFLLMWGVTGAGFELHWVNTAWYAVTGGHNAEAPTFTSAAVKNSRTLDIGLDRALAAAQAQAGPGASIKYVGVPASDDPTATYSFYFARDFDQYSHGAYPGQYGVDVDRHNAARLQVNDLGDAPTVSNKLLDTWGPATFHYGESVNGWWRVIWLLFGLSPLALAVTGVSTWLFKRKVRKRRARAGRPATSAGPTAQPATP